MKNKKETKQAINQELIQEQDLEISLGERTKYENRLLVDYLQMTFTDFKIRKHLVLTPNGTKYSWEIQNKDLLKKLLINLGCKKEWKDLDTIGGISGFAEGKVIGEHIKIFYGTIHSGWGQDYNKDTGEIEPVIGDYVLMLTLTGQACREFETYGGNWLKLFNHIFKNHSNYKVKRLDLAYDDFFGENFQIKDLINLVEKKSYRAMSKKWSLNKSGGKRKYDGGEGVSLTIGAPKQNQLVIYDKLIENLESKKQEFYGTCWNRYELRLRKDAAKSLFLIINAREMELNSQDFLQTYFELVMKVFEPKDPNDLNPRITRKKTWQPWLEFINYAKKSDISFKAKKEVTLERSTKWYFNATPKLLAAMMLTTNDSLEQFLLKFVDFFIYSNTKDKKSQMQEQVETFLKERNIDLSADKAWELLIIRMKELKQFVEKSRHEVPENKKDKREFNLLIQDKDAIKESNNNEIQEKDAIKESNNNEIQEKEQVKNDKTKNIVLEKINISKEVINDVPLIDLNKIKKRHVGELNLNKKKENVKEFLLKPDNKANEKSFNLKKVKKKEKGEKKNGI